MSAQRVLRAASLVVCVGSCFGVQAPAAAQTPQVTSEIPCSRDAQCPEHGGLCFANWLPGCGCNEGRGTCDANPKACQAANDCFGQEICSNENRCVEPGPPPGTPCNNDAECAAWMSCLLGQCSRGECVVDGDCTDERICSRNSCVRGPCSSDGQCEGGQVCRDAVCVAVQCISDTECDAREVCSGGRCRQVECREAAHCSNCAVCDASNSCVSLCREGEECLAFPGLGRQGHPFVVRRCAQPDAACTASTQCPIGEKCLGGRCFDLRALLHDFEMGLSRDFALPPKPERIP